MMEEKIKILFTGDFYGGGRIAELIQSENYQSIFNDFLNEIKDADISVTNLEAPITKCNHSILKTGPALKAPPNTSQIMRNAGFNLVTLANNHIMDFGEEGLKDTFSALDSENIAYLGAGKNLDEASKPTLITVKGKILAFLNFAENEWSTTQGKEFGANPLNPVRNYNAIKETREKVDYLFVIIHGGHEMYPLPSPRMKETYRFFIDAGADSVIGHHTHCYSGFEIFKGKTIFYSIGNFLFDSSIKQNLIWHYGYAVRLIIKDKKITFEMVPFKQNLDKIGINLLSDVELEDFGVNINRLNCIIQDDELLSNQFDLYAKSKKKPYYGYIEPHTNRYIYAIQNRGLLPSFLTKKKKLLYTNLFRCESHRDVILNLFRKEQE